MLHSDVGGNSEGAAEAEHLAVHPFSLYGLSEFTVWYLEVYRQRRNYVKAGRAEPYEKRIAYSKGNREEIILQIPNSQSVKAFQQLFAVLCQVGGKAKSDIAPSQPVIAVAEEQTR